MDQPYFLAVCRDRPEDPHGFWYTVYFVNNTEDYIERLSYETGGFATFDDEVVQTSIHKRDLGKVPAFSFVEVEKDDEGAFDFTIAFTFSLELENGMRKSQDFMINKYLRGGTKPFERMPVLNKFGYTFRSK
ncbi:hypothetical protein [Evansella tamaricis]|uniref:Cytosolic protein n=1 Tax=Evansella tamaricis TaxID=2069301 RepID=A0ABS6JP97_9BACI|nr:hypothetical protein [Evansella tamaricis]MBU9714128.1 hypothetical protein [Evansella tamaricis]